MLHESIKKNELAEAAEKAAELAKRLKSQRMKPNQNNDIDIN